MTAPESAAVQGEIKRLIRRYPDLLPVEGEISRGVELIITVLSAGGTVLTAGNGGSAADAVHIVGELMKSFQRPRPLTKAVVDGISQADMPDDIREQLVTHLEMPLRAQSLVEGLSLSTAFSNDAQPQLAMAQQLLGSARRGDLLIAISTSGNSENILLAAYLARAMGVSVLALTGGTGGALREAADIAVVVPGSTTAEIQEFHLPVYHCLCAAAEAYFF